MSKNKKPQLVDTHCHLDFDRYDQDRDKVIKRAKDAGVTRIIIPAVDVASCKSAIKLANKHRQMYASAGVHPNSTANFTSYALKDIETAAKNRKVVAIGEIGLDYYRERSPKSKQKQAFEKQIELAARLELPLIIHNRDAEKDTLPILENWVTDLPDSLKDRPGVFHSFLADQGTAQRAIDAGFYLGFTGPITFKNNKDMHRVVASVPLDRILVETDGPYLTPEPYRGKRNEPSYIPHIIKKIAELHSVSVDEVSRITTENAIRLFQLDD